MQTLAEYERLARMTLPTNGCDAVMHGTLGLMSEVGELATAFSEYWGGKDDLDVLNLVEECGDILWYTLRVINGLGLTLTEAMGVREFFELEHKLRVRADGVYSSSGVGVTALTGVVGLLADGQKRVLAYGKSPNPDTQLGCCVLLVEGLCRLLASFGKTLETAATANIIKLSGRNEALRADPALRDIDAERKAMSSAIH